MLLCYSNNFSNVQVAFGSDFSEQWDDKTLGLKLTKGNGKLTFLISHTFKGVQRAFAGGPFFQVISKLHVGTEKLNNVLGNFLVKTY